MKNKIHKKLALKKITISTYRILGGTDDDMKSSAFHEPTEQPILIEDPRLISANNESCY
ncbi:hypothetical protein [uncultured Kordia sp.]|uniref:hypothetical protein n=1 Tax=uncultured Kordia sp. TaxID=507699 RepID=UPI00263511FE|nr:hypothetical protein [uncultured Kordia sp.]